MAKKTVTVTKESSTGRNIQFYDRSKSVDMTRPQFVKKIKTGKYPGYHVRVINGVETPVSNPDGSDRNNLD